tara:strand:+ start:1221 stop:1727 length:507 start_codon:yes stop_codon:yes gene_type:complete
MLTNYKKKYNKYKKKYILLKKLLKGSGHKDILVEPKCKICKSEGKKIIEGEEWLAATGNKNVVLCSNHYMDYKTKYKEYKELFIEAKNDISNNKFTDSIIKLEESIRQRHHVGNTFFISINTGHAYFSDEFLPTLINKIREGIKKEWTPKKMLEEWDILYTSVSKSDN